MTERKRYLLCPQCGSRRLCLKDERGKNHFIYIYWDQTIVYAKTGQPIPPDLKTDVIWCADCSWKGTIRKLIKYATS